GRFHSGGTGTASVLTARMRQGDFSELLNPALMCSSSGGVCPSNKSLIRLYNATANGTPIYANNQIPVLNPAAQYLFAHPELYPLPNRAPDASNTPARNNYAGPTKQRNYGNQFDIKVDWRASQ